MAEPVYCPDCKPIRSRRGTRISGRLEVHEANHSGTGADMMECPDCSHVFCVTYKVDTISRDTAWEDAEKVARLAREREDRIASNIVMLLAMSEPGSEAREKAMRLAAEFKAKRDAERSNNDA